MNQKLLRELAIRGGIYDCICDPYDKLQNGDHHSSVMGDLDRFAEKIIRLCADIAMREDHDPAKCILKHFEVEKMSEGMKPCPFCGHEVDLDDSDTLYPSGVGWEDHPEHEIRGYVPFHTVPKEQWCYSMHCPTPAGGCGAEVSGDSRQEAIDKWNKRV